MRCIWKRLLCPCSSCWHVSNLLVFWTFLHHTSRFVGSSTYYCTCLLFLKLLAGVMCCCIACPFFTNCVSFLSYSLCFAFFLLHFAFSISFLTFFFVFSMSGLDFVFFMLKYLKFPFLFSAIIIQFWFFLLSFCFVGFGFCCRDFVSSMHAVFGKECCLFLLFWFSLLSFCSMHALCVSHFLWLRGAKQGKPKQNPIPCLLCTFVLSLSTGGRQKAIHR